MSAEQGGVGFGPLVAGPGIVDWVLVGALTLLAGVIGVFGIFFLPLYNGSFPSPWWCRRSRSRSP